MDATEIHKPESLVSHIHENNTTQEQGTVQLTAEVDAVGLKPGDGGDGNLSKGSAPCLASVAKAVKTLDNVNSDSSVEKTDTGIADHCENDRETVDKDNSSRNNKNSEGSGDASSTNAVLPSESHVETPLASPKPSSGKVADGNEGVKLPTVLPSVEKPTVSYESRSNEVVPSTDIVSTRTTEDKPAETGDVVTTVEQPVAVENTTINCNDDQKQRHAIPDGKAKDKPNVLPKELEKAVDNVPQEKSTCDTASKKDVSVSKDEEVDVNINHLSKNDQEKIPVDSSEDSSGTKVDCADGDKEVNVVKPSDVLCASGGLPTVSEGEGRAAESCKVVDEDETSMNEDELLKGGSDHQPDEESSMNLDEMAANLDETGDDDQEMQEFLHVKDKDLDISEDAHDAANVTDVDPIGLADEPNPKIDIADEPMDMDELRNEDGVLDDDKAVRDDDRSVPGDDKVVHDDEKEIPGPEEVAMEHVDAAETYHVGGTDVDPIGSSDNVDPIEDVDMGEGAAVEAVEHETTEEAVEHETTGEAIEHEATEESVERETTEEAVEHETSGEASGKEPVATIDSGAVSAESEVVYGDDASSGKPSLDESIINDNNDDEEICIIPDTIRIPPPGTVIPDKPGEKGTTSDVTSAPTSVTNDVSIVATVVSVQKAKAAVSEVAGSSRPQRQAAKKAESQIKELARDDSNSGDSELVNSYSKPDRITPVESSPHTCMQCKRTTTCQYQLRVAGQRCYLCGDDCTKLYNAVDRSKAVAVTVVAGFAAATDDLVTMTQDAVTSIPEDFCRKCSECSAKITGDEKNLAWETMDFCNEECLGKYQLELGSFCANCKGAVANPSLGKYCVRFGYDIKQFCCSSCLEEFKKGLKVCSYCQKDISNDNEGFLAPVGNKGIFKDFCTQACMEKYDYMGAHLPPPAETTECAVCKVEKVVQVEVILKTKLHKLCSDPCFAAFKFVNNLTTGTSKCEMCMKHFDKLRTEKFSIFADNAISVFCTKTCMNVYILAKRKIVPCHWCKVKKYNFDMIKRVNNQTQVLMMCSLNCLALYQVSVNAVSSKKIKCDCCRQVNQAQYHLTMSDATIRNFCAYECVMKFQGQYSKSPPLTLPPGAEKPVIPTGPIVSNGSKLGTGATYARRAQTAVQNDAQSQPQQSSMPVISSVTSLAPNGQRATTLKANSVPAQPPPKPQLVYKQQVIVKAAAPKEMRNKAVGCKAFMANKGSSCRPICSNKESQTDDTIGRPIFIPVPVPIYVPAPMHMFSVPLPMPVPFPLPIPVPMFIPTTRNSISGIMKEMKRIQEKIPADPFEAELLMMAEMVADDKKADNSDSDSDDGGDNGAQDISEVPEAGSATEGGFSPEAVDTSNFGEDMLQMALKMASELDEPAVDLEAALTPTTISAPPNATLEHSEVTESEMDDAEPVDRGAMRGRKRGIPVQRRGSMGTPSKRGRRISSSGGGGDIPLLPPPEPPTTPRIEVEKPDANMCLKYTFGVNAWRQWVNAKNAELEKANNTRKPLKLFKPEILQLTSDELNYSLCLFVKEVRKPNGTEYAPDTIYYLVLGIQQYLFENGRIDNIFTDAYYEKFTECLDEVAKKFSDIFSEQQYIVTRVEEEHLWESKQLGAHSPHVLLSTLMFFNTKHFNLTTVEEHMQLSFSHIMKHWKRNPNQPGATKVPGSRNVLLRFYPPQATLEANSRKKKVYEQQENEENPLRCPVKLYEFYLSKCPESVKTRNDVFYLLPERSCVPDSPVWYSTMALGKDPLIKMLHRVKMVKEINMALLTS